MQGWVCKECLETVLTRTRRTASWRVFRRFRCRARWTATRRTAAGSGWAACNFPRTDKRCFVVAARAGFRSFWWTSLVRVFAETSKTDFWWFLVCYYFIATIIITIRGKKISRTNFVICSWEFASSLNSLTFWLLFFCTFRLKVDCASGILRWEGKDENYWGTFACVLAFWMQKFWRLVWVWFFCIFWEAHSTVPALQHFKFNFLAK